jgi:hypothetical protein
MKKRKPKPFAGLLKSNNANQELFLSTPEINARRKL